MIEYVATVQCILFSDIVQNNLPRTCKAGLSVLLASPFANSNVKQPKIKTCMFIKCFDYKREEKEAKVNVQAIDNLK